MMLIEFKPEHLEEMNMTEDLKKFARSRVPALTGLAAVHMAGTIAAPSGAPLLGVLGAWPVDRKTCEVFVLGAEARRKYPMEFVTTVRGALSNISCYFDRIQALGKDTAFFNRWFRWLGFTKEGPADRPGCKGLLMWRFKGAR